jgi:hypothetical protein
MLGRQDKEPLWFSTGIELKINGVIYRPSICYEVPLFAKAALEEYAAKGKVKFYKKPVQFANGIEIDIPEIKPKISKTTGAPKQVERETKKRKKNDSWSPKF